MTKRDKITFIDNELNEYHNFLAQNDKCDSLINECFKRVLHPQKPPPVTASRYTNFRDIFWHYEALCNCNKMCTVTEVQYAMIIDHMNVAIIDTTVSSLQRLYWVLRGFANAAANIIRNDELKAERDRMDIIALTKTVYPLARDGFIKTRKALYLLRSRKCGMDYCESVKSTDYYISAMALYDVSFSSLVQIVRTYGWDDIKSLRMKQ